MQHTGTAEADTTPRPAAHARTILALQIVVAILAAFRLFYDITAMPAADEAYYWMWGQHPDWSYFDHPPLHAWLLGLVSTILGWHNFSVRALTWVTLGGVFLIFRAWAPRLAPENPRLLLWTSFAIYFASPFYFFMTGIAYHDHLLVFLGLLTVHCMAEFVFRIENDRDGAIAWLYAAAISLGLAVLTKYNGVVIGVAMAAVILMRPRLRALLATPHPWLAALISIGMQAPVIGWNIAHGFASFRFHLDDRWGGTGGLHISVLAPFLYIVLNVLLLSPVLLWPLGKAIARGPASSFEAALRPLAFSVLTLSSLGFLAITLLLGGFFYWNILAFPPSFPLIARHIGQRILLWVHLTFGVVFAGLVSLNYSVLPILPLVNYVDRGTSINIGWDEVTAHFKAAQTAHPADLAAATRYSTTSQLGFVLGTTNVVPIEIEPPLQWKYWIHPADYAGKSALILTDEADNSAVIAHLKASFDNLTVVDDFQIRRAGKAIYRWRIFRGDNYRPAGANP